MTIKVKQYIDNLAQEIIELEVTSEYDGLLLPTVTAIRKFYNRGVGLSDTASREAMANYFEEQLAETFDAVDYTQMRQDFWEML